MQPHEGHDEHEHPQHGLQIQRQPEEAAVGRVDGLGAGLAALKHPLRVARLRVDFVPPAEPDEAPARDVLEVVEVAREEEDGDDEDHDPVSRVLVVRLRGHGWLLGGTWGLERHIHAGCEPETEEVDQDACFGMVSDGFDGDRNSMESSRGLTYPEAQERQQGDGMRAKSPAQRASRRRRRRLRSIHIANPKSLF